MLCVQGFNDDDKIAVGLLQRPTLTSMLFGSPSQASGEASLTDAWVQFLMEESTSPPSGMLCVKRMGGQSTL